MEKLFTHSRLMCAGNVFVTHAIHLFDTMLLGVYSECTGLVFLSGNANMTV